MSRLKRKRSPTLRARQRGFSWKSWLLGAAMGAVGCWLALENRYNGEALVVPRTEEAAVVDQPSEEGGADDIAETLPIEFYQLLPEREEHVSDHVVSGRLSEQQVESGAAASPTPAARYRIQAGSFQKEAEAGGRRANILLLGLNARIEKVTHAGKVWHRVILGPYESLGRIEADKKRLKANNIDSITLKLK